MAKAASVLLLPRRLSKIPSAMAAARLSEAVSGEARFAYFPASSVGDTTAVSVQTTDQSLQAGGKGRKGPGRKAGEATGLAGREAPPNP